MTVATSKPPMRDVVGRFLLGMVGHDAKVPEPKYTPGWGYQGFDGQDAVAGCYRFSTDGQRIQSYENWTLAERDSEGNISFTDRMWEKPYGQTTRRHMDAVYHGLKDRVVSRDMPDHLQSQMADAMLRRANQRTAPSTAERELRDMVNYMMRIPWQAITDRALAEVREQRARSLANYATGYIPATVAAYRDYQIAYDAITVAYLECYAARLTFVPQVIGTKTVRGYQYSYERNVYSTPPRVKVPKTPTFPGYPAPIIECSYIGDAAENHCGPDGILAWHFHNGTLAFGDGRKVVDGATYTPQPRPGMSDDELVMCGYGMHGSLTLQDAYGWRTTREYVSLVRLDGRVVRSPAKLCAESRTVLATVRFDDILCDTWAETELAIYDRMGVY